MLSIFKETTLHTFMLAFSIDILLNTFGHACVVALMCKHLYRIGPLSSFLHLYFMEEQKFELSDKVFGGKEKQILKTVEKDKKKKLKKKNFFWLRLSVKEQDRTRPFLVPN